jgi:phage terminase large subunit GpA-like protein
MLFTGSPGLRGLSRLEAYWQRSDQRRPHICCPHCGHWQTLVWSGLTWTDDGREAVYLCAECQRPIPERMKPELFARVQWRPTNPNADSGVRGYTWNALYFGLGMGSRWADLAAEWRDAVNDPAKLKVFVNERLAETWEDPRLRSVKHNLVRDRAEPYALREAPAGALAVTAGVDVQDDRLEVQIIGWGRGMAAWTLDYVVLPGDPEADAVWLALTDLLNRPIHHAIGAPMPVEATAVDTGGHRGEAVKAWVRAARVRRAIAIKGAVANSAPALGKPSLVDLTWQGRTDKRGVHLYQVGTVAIKHVLYARLSGDADKTSADTRSVHFSDQLPPEFFTGITSETFDPARNRFILRKGQRNEALDTWVYAYAAAHHPELRLHRLSRADWDAREARLLSAAEQRRNAPAGATPAALTPAPAAAPPPPSPFGSAAWGSRL